MHALSSGLSKRHFWLSGIINHHKRIACRKNISKYQESRIRFHLSCKYNKDDYTPPITLFFGPGEIYRVIGTTVLQEEGFSNKWEN